MNLTADAESRVMRDRSDWKLDQQVFLRINNVYGPLEVDLFASRLTNQCCRFFSWQPDPLAEATDAFCQNWVGMKVYANPPWNLISRVLAKTQTQGADLTLVAPEWKAQPWYAVLLSMLVDWPRLLPAQSIPTSASIPIQPKLAVWNISGRDSMVKAFQAKLQNLSLSHGGQKPTSHMTPFLGDGVAGVVNGVQIHFQDL